MNATTYRDLISGTRRGLVADAARCGLKAASLVYGAAVYSRNLAFDHRLLASCRVPVPVVSIGNLTAGGTGKTPMVAAVVNWFAAQGVRPVILSRGYRAGAGGSNDEKLVLDQQCPGIAHLQGADRVKLAQIAIERYSAQVLVLDDGFQHRRLARDLDLVLIDALDPWGGGHLLPRGLLREPPSWLKRAHVIILTRVDQCSDESTRGILSEIRRLGVPDPPIQVVFVPTGFANSAGEAKDMKSLSGHVAAFCGIGNPEGFRRTLAVVFKPNEVHFQIFPDHHLYRQDELTQLAGWARTCGACALVTTQKDLVKIPRRDVDGMPLWALRIEAQIVKGQDGLFFSRLESLMHPVSSQSRLRAWDPGDD